MANRTPAQAHVVSYSDDQYNGTHIVLWFDGSSDTELCTFRNRQQAENVARLMNIGTGR